MFHWYNFGGRVRRYNTGDAVAPLAVREAGQAYASGSENVDPFTGEVISRAPGHVGAADIPIASQFTSANVTPTSYVDNYMAPDSSFSVGTGPQRNTEAEAAATAFEVNPGNNWEVPGVAEHIAEYSVAPPSTENYDQADLDGFFDGNALDNVISGEPIEGGQWGDDTAQFYAENVDERPDAIYGDETGIYQPDLDIVTNDDQFTMFDPYVEGSGQLLGDDYEVATEAVPMNTIEQGYLFDNTGTDTDASYVDESQYVQHQPPAVSDNPYSSTLYGGTNNTGFSSPGVNTGIPQGGYARNAIDAYLGGTNQATNSYTSGQAALAEQQAANDFDREEYIAGLNTASDEIYDANNAPEVVESAGDDGGMTIEDLEAVQGELTLDDGETTIDYDSAHEEVLANDIVDIIEAGGVNEETGDYNISAGPNVLSATDEGVFGIGDDYNEEFVENFDANSEHSDNNPTGQTTGTPLYDQGYVGLNDNLSDTIGGALNNSTIGMIGEAITGEPMLADVSSLLPPEESFSNYNDSSSNDDPFNNTSPHDSGGSVDVNNDGNASNDTGNAGWNFTSIADIFDGGGAGSSGDSYTGGIWGDSTVGDTSVGVSSIFSSNDSDSGGSDSGGGDTGGGGGGYSCYVATALRDHGYWSDFKRIRLIAWCMKAKPEGKLDTKLWRNGYCEFGKKVIAPRADNKAIRWLSDGFYNSTVHKKKSVKSLLGKAFFYIPSYAIGLYKLATGKLEEIDRT